jgi:hypothetical protein
MKETTRLAFHVIPQDLGDGASECIPLPGGDGVEDRQGQGTQQVTALFDPLPS